MRRFDDVLAITIALISLVLGVGFLILMLNFLTFSPKLIQDAMPTHKGSTDAPADVNGGF